MICGDHLFERVTLTTNVGEHLAGDIGTLVHLDDHGYGVIEFEQGRMLQIVRLDEAEPATPARPTTPAA